MEEEMDIEMDTAMISGVPINRGPMMVILGSCCDCNSKCLFPSDSQQGEAQQV